MPKLERKCTVKMRVDDAEKHWTEFTSKQQSQGKQAPAGNGSGNATDPGTVYFNDAGDGKTQVTIQLNSDGVAEGDEKTLNQRVDGYLQQFKEFAEAK